MIESEPSRYGGYVVYRSVIELFNSVFTGRYGGYPVYNPYKATAGRPRLIHYCRK
ncbi:MAG: hypothetical protein LBC81_01700 [Tannerellaceae bacterium]|jgi:hypothetical protein|nr:hypothetical protein [Tannerellaceae bacterium]